MSKPELPPTVVRLGHEWLGPPRSVRELTRPGGNARVLVWEGSQGRAVLKVHASARTFRQELGAYRQWLPALEQVPALLGAHEPQPHVLFLEWIPGTPLSDGTVTAEQEVRAWQRAGAWLRGLHALPFEDTDALRLEAAYRERLAGLAAGDPHSVGLVAWLERTFARVRPQLEASSRTPCHRDFEPRNWLVDEAGRWLAAIDFEHARPDHPLSDLSRAAAYVWTRRPHLEHAFWAGYGRAPGESERRLVHAFAVLDAVQRRSWAARHGDLTLAASARRALRDLGAPV